MKHHLTKWRPREWPDVFEMVLTAASLWSGLVYTLGPERLRAIYVWINGLTDGTLGMQAVGALWLLAGLLQLGSKIIEPRPTNLRRIGHALAAGVYFIMAVGLVAPLVVGGPVASGAAFWVYVIPMLLHVYFGTEQPRLTRRPGARKGPPAGPDLTKEG